MPVTFRRPALEASLLDDLDAHRLVVVTGPRSPHAGETMKMSFDAALADSGIVAASIDGELATELFSRADKDLSQIQEALDTGNPHVAGFKPG